MKTSQGGFEKRGPCRSTQAADFVLQACVAIADAHALGIVHRDLKPANLFCIRRSDGQLLVKVLDFGISKLTDVARASNPPGMSVTKTASVMGTPLYMSPEQVQSAKDVDVRTDIWALGVILFELLTRSVPFQGESFGELAVKVSTNPTPSVRTHRPDVPTLLDAVIARCLEKDRRQRFANVAEFALALHRFAPKRSKASVERITGIIQAAGLSASALTLPPSPPVRAETMVATGSVAPWSATPRNGGGKIALRIIAGIGLTTGAVVVAASVHRPSAAPTPAAAVFSIPSSGTVAKLPTTPTATLTLVPQPPTEGTPSASAMLSVGVSGDSSHAPSQIPSAEPVFPRTLPAVPTSPRPGPAAPTRPVPTIAVSSARAQASPSCDPNYYLDGNGEKRFKPECFGISATSAHAP